MSRIVLSFIVCFPALLLFAATLVKAEGFADTLAKVKPSIVAVATYLPTRRPPSRIIGTGFVIGNGSSIVTNAHVVDAELDDLKGERLVVFSGTGRKPQLIAADIAAIDESRDLAVLSVKRKLPPLKLSSKVVREGEIYAFTGFPIGSVLGLYPVTHRGMISSITPIAIPAPSSGQLNASKIKRLKNPMLAYQLDATAYPGNSGSPMFDMESGHVIGILNQVYIKKTKEDVLSAPSGISYAIPIKYLNKLLTKTSGQ